MAITDRELQDLIDSYILTNFRPINPPVRRSRKKRATKPSNRAVGDIRLAKTVNTTYTDAIKALLHEAKYNKARKK